ncbi:PilZ domain-containing protein [Thermodesulfobacteriota bacterium]
MGENTREYERKEVSVGLHGSIKKIEGFSLLDLSQSGALISSLEHLKIGNRYLINFDLGNGELVPIKSEVIRCTLLCKKSAAEAKAVPTYEIGLRFIDIDKYKLAKLSAYISKEEHKVT